MAEKHIKIQIKHKLQTIKEDIFKIQALFGLIKLNEHTPFFIPTKYTFLISTNIKWAHPTWFGTCVPSSGRTQCQFLKTKCYCEDLQIPWSVAALSLMLMICTIYSCISLKTYGYTMVKNISYY